MASRNLPLIPWSKTCLLSGHSASRSTSPVLQTIIDLFVLGYADSANKLVDSLWEHSHGREYDMYGQGTARMEIIYHAWESTDTMPTYIKDPGTDKLFIPGPKSKGYKSNNHWKNLDGAWAKGLPKSMREKALKGELDETDLKQVSEMMNKTPGKDNVEEKSTIAAVIQVAILAGKEDVARKLVNEDVVGLYRYISEKLDDSEVSGKELRKWIDDQLGLQYSPGIWNIQKEAQIGQALEVDETSLEAFTDEGCGLIKQRFTHGPTRPYADKSISELVQIMDEGYIVAREEAPDAGSGMCVLNADHVPKTFLTTPGTEDEIAALEDRLSKMPAPGENEDEDEDGEDNENNNDDENDDGRDDEEDDASSRGSHAEEVDDDEEEGEGENGATDEPHKRKRRTLPEKHLPDDYREFLRMTNGFQVGKGDSTGIFCSIEEVGTDDVDYLHDMDYTLFPYEYTTLDVNMDNIPLGKFSCFSIGSGGDEGSVVLIPPSSVKPVFEAFEKTYAEASARNKKFYERAAVDLYGGLDGVRALDWLVVVCYHWDPDERIYGSFRQYLESAVADAVEQRKEVEKTAKKREEREAKKGDDAKRGDGRKRIGKS